MGAEILFTGAAGWVMLSLILLNSVLFIAGMIMSSIKFPSMAVSKMSSFIWYTFYAVVLVTIVIAIFLYIHTANQPVRRTPTGALVVAPPAGGSYTAPAGAAPAPPSVATPVPPPAVPADAGAPAPGTGK